MARLAEDLAATRAELAGLALLLVGGIVVTVAVVGRLPTTSPAGTGPTPVVPVAPSTSTAPVDPTASAAPESATGVVPSDSPPGPAAAPAAAPAAGQSAGPAGSDPPASGGVAADAVGLVVVHVTGSVGSPGVVEVPAGARLVDVVAAAGGTRGDAAVDVLNLAQVAVDGQRLHVPTTTEVAELADGAGADGAGADGAEVGIGPATAQLDPGTGLPPGPASGAAGSAQAEIAPGDDGPSGDGVASGGAAGGVIDLNVADEPTLEQLPGVGPVLAGRIVAWREEHGGFVDVGQLREVSGIGEVTFQDLAPLVTVS